MLLSGCGKPVEVQIKAPDKPVVVEHRFIISDIEKYFKVLCEKENPTDTPEQIKACVDLGVAEFLDAIK